MFIIGQKGTALNIDHVLTIKIHERDGRYILEAGLTSPSIMDNGHARYAASLGVFAAKDDAERELKRLVTELNGAGSARVSSVIRELGAPADGAIEDLCIRVREG